MALGNPDLVIDACMSTKELAGLLDETKEHSTKALTTMFATHEHVTKAQSIEFDELIDDGYEGMTPAIQKCDRAPDIPDMGFMTKQFRPASYADSYQINNCERCPIRLPLEREYDFLDPDEKLMAHRAMALNKFERRRDNRWEYDIAQLISHGGFWVRFQDERGQEVERHYVQFPRHEALSGMAVGTAWDDANANIVADLQQFVDIHSDITCRDVTKVILGANVAKCIRQSSQFNVCPEKACFSDLNRYPSFAQEMLSPCNRMFEGMRDFGSYCDIDYFLYNGKVKNAEGQLEYLIDPDCVYTVALLPSQDAISRLYSRFSTLTGGPVENKIWHREFYEERPDTLDMEDRYCGMPGMLHENVFAKWRVKGPEVGAGVVGP